MSPYSIRKNVMDILMSRKGAQSNEKNMESIYYDNIGRGIA